MDRNFHTFFGLCKKWQASWSKVLLETLMIAQLGNKLPAHNETQGSQLWHQPSTLVTMHSILSHPIRVNIILHLWLGFQPGISFQRLRLKFCIHFVISITRATCSVHLALLDLMIIYSERCPITLLRSITSTSPMGKVCGWGIRFCRNA